MRKSPLHLSLEPSREWGAAEAADLPCLHPNGKVCPRIVTGLGWGV